MTDGCEIPTVGVVDLGVEMGVGERIVGCVVGVVLIGGALCACTPATSTADPAGSSSTLVPLAGSSSYPDAAQSSQVTRVEPGTGIDHVIDGDSFALTDGHQVRVLGIDSCEMSTPGGRWAKQDAEALLAGGSVAMTTEPGVDTDRYGRLLRYVRTASGGDFGTAMVRQPHTAVYGGRNDAAPQRVAALRAADPNGRDCSGPPEVSTRTIVVPAPDHDDHDRYRYVVPDLPDVHVGNGPDRTARPRTGHSGHPCLPGERDGDGDGYCKEHR